MKNDCVCGGETVKYDGMLGYEAMVCQRCGLHYNTYSKEEHEIQLKKYEKIHNHLAAAKVVEGNFNFVIRYYNKSFNFWNDVASFTLRNRALDFIDSIQKENYNSIYALYERTSPGYLKLIKMVGLDRLTRF